MISGFERCASVPALRSRSRARRAGKRAAFSRPVSSAAKNSSLVLRGSFTSLSRGGVRFFASKDSVSLVPALVSGAPWSF